MADEVESGRRGFRAFATSRPAAPPEAGLAAPIGAKHDGQLGAGHDEQLEGEPGPSLIAGPSAALEVGHQALREPGRGAPVDAGHGAPPEMERSRQIEPEYAADRQAAPKETVAEIQIGGNSQAPRRNRIMLVFVVVLLTVWLLWAARGALLPYVLALVLGYLLLPLVNWLDRRLTRLIRRAGPARALAILATYIACGAAVALFISMLVPVLTQQFNALWNMRFDMANQVQDFAQRGLSWYYEHVPLDLQTQVELNLRKAGDTIGAAIQLGLTRTFTIVTGTVGFILGFVVVPFWLFYVLYDQVRIRGAAQGMFPERYRGDVLNIVHLIDTDLGAYIRGQLLLALAIGLMAGAGLTLLGVSFPAVLALMAGLFELLPFIGPILGLIPAVLVALIQSPILALWTVLLFLGIQQIENYVLAPRIAGRAVALHPAAIMLVLVVGNEVAGLWGMLIAVPVTAIIRDVFRYLYLRFQDRPCSAEEALTRVGRR